MAVRIEREHKAAAERDVPRRDARRDRRISRARHADAVEDQLSAVAELKVLVAEVHCPGDVGRRAVGQRQFGGIGHFVEFDKRIAVGRSRSVERQVPVVGDEFAAEAGKRIRRELKFFCIAYRFTEGDRQLSGAGNRIAPRPNAVRCLTGFSQFEAGNAVPVQNNRSGSQMALDVAGGRNMRAAFNVHAAGEFVVAGKFNVRAVHEHETARTVQSISESTGRGDAVEHKIRPGFDDLNRAVAERSRMVNREVRTAFETNRHVELLVRPEHSAAVRDRERAGCTLSRLERTCRVERRDKLISTEEDRAALRNIELASAAERILRRKTKRAVALNIRVAGIGIRRLDGNGIRNGQVALTINLVADGAGFINAVADAVIRLKCQRLKIKIQIQIATA